MSQLIKTTTTSPLDQKPIHYNINEQNNGPYSYIPTNGPVNGPINGSTMASINGPVSIISPLSIASSTYENYKLLTIRTKTRSL